MSDPHQIHQIRALLGQLDQGDLQGKELFSTLIDQKSVDLQDLQENFHALEGGREQEAERALPEEAYLHK